MKGSPLFTKFDSKHEHVLPASAEPNRPDSAPNRGAACRSGPQLNPNLWLVLLLVLAGVLLYVFLPPASPGTSASDGSVSGDFVMISVGGEEKLRVPLSEPQTVTLSQPDGRENVIVVTAEGAYMERSTCHNQICVHSGQVTRNNWEFRTDGAFIICLPNQVSVELVVNTLDE